MGKLIVAATVGVVSICVYIVGYVFAAVFGILVVAGLVLLTYPQKSAEVDASNKAVIITGK